MAVSSCVVVAAVILLIVIAALVWMNNKNKEGFRQCGRNEFALNDTYAEILDVPQAIVVPPTPATPLAQPLSVPAVAVNAAQFANMVTDGDAYVDLEASAATEAAACGAKRLQERYCLALQRDAFPRLPACCSQFGVDTTLATAGAYGLSIPTVSMKDPLWLRSDMLRGDIPINFSDVPLITKSSYGVGNMNLSGIFRDCGRRKLNVKYEGLTVEGPQCCQ